MFLGFLEKRNEMRRWEVKEEGEHPLMEEGGRPFLRSFDGWDGREREKKENETTR